MAKHLSQTAIALMVLSACTVSIAQELRFTPVPAIDSQTAPLSAIDSTQTSAPKAIQPGGQAWWNQSVSSALDPNSPSVQISVEDLLVRALQSSSQVRVFSELPLIRETSIVEASAAFDWHAFMDSRWDDTSDPVGNNLTVGGNGTRFRDHNLSASVGARRRTYTGGQIEVAQRFGFQDNNSTFFTPDPQGTSRLVLSYTQPLMRGRGKCYNQSLTVLARIDTQIANDEFNRQLQSHLLEVVRAYWGLYLERGIYTQKSRGYQRSVEIFDRLKQRRDIDTMESQLLSAEAEVKSRRSELKRSRVAVKNAEDRIRSLVNDPAIADDNLELVPVDVPTMEAFPASMQESLVMAIQHRPEINQALKQLKAACVRVNMSKNEMMPVLNLVTETYVSGLRGDSNIGGAWQDQFGVGEPSYSIGLQFEVPINNRAARSRNTRRRLEMRQLQSQYETTVQTLKLETRVAVREVETSFDELDTKLSAMQAMKAKNSYILRRWELMPGEGRSGSYVLEDLLAAQSHLSRTENEFLTSVVTYNLALMNLKRATGMLLQHEQVSIGRTCENCLPRQTVAKPFIQRLTDGVQHVPPEVPMEMAPVPMVPLESTSFGTSGPVKSTSSSGGLAGKIRL